jgi:hypothetical protein
MTLRQLNRRCGPLSQATTAQIMALPLDQLEALSDALLDFQGPADLTSWLPAYTWRCSRNDPLGRGWPINPRGHRFPYDLQPAPRAFLCSADVPPGVFPLRWPTAQLPPVDETQNRASVHAVSVLSLQLGKRVHDGCHLHSGDQPGRALVGGLG